MSAMSNLIMDIQDELQNGFLSLEEIARKFEVPTDWVVEAAAMLAEEGEAQ
jgi:hypothetical protein